MTSRKLRRMRNRSERLKEVKASMFRYRAPSSFWEKYHLNRPS